MNNNSADDFFFERNRNSRDKLFALLLCDANVSFLQGKIWKDLRLEITKSEIKIKIHNLTPQLIDLIYSADNPYDLKTNQEKDAPYNKYGTIRSSLDNLYLLNSFILQHLQHLINIKKVDDTSSRSLFSSMLSNNYAVPKNEDYGYQQFVADSLHPQKFAHLNTQPYWDWTDSNSILNVKNVDPQNANQNANAVELAFINGELNNAEDGRFMRYPEIPFWQKTSRPLDGLDRDIKETLNSSANEKINNKYQKWDVDGFLSKAGVDWKTEEIRTTEDGQFWSKVCAKFD
jgi:hypothetical protein